MAVVPPPILPPILLAFALMLGGGLVQAQGGGALEPSVTLERLDGLSHNTVLSLLQDHRGFLWIGTADGLNRYDGYGVTVFRHDPREPAPAQAGDASLSDNTIRALAETPDGALWVGTEDGLDRLDPATGRFRREALPLSGAPSYPEGLPCAGASGYLLKPSSGPQIVEAVWAARAGGAPITLQIARKVLDLFTDLAVPRGDYGLTPREREVLECLVGGRTKQQIADDLFVSYHTVDMHVRNIYAKLHVHSRSGAVAKALKERLV